MNIECKSEHLPPINPIRPPGTFPWLRGGVSQEKQAAA